MIDVGEVHQDAGMRSNAYRLVFAANFGVASVTEPSSSKADSISLVAIRVTHLVTFFLTSKSYFEIPFPPAHEAFTERMMSASVVFPQKSRGTRRIMPRFTARRMKL